MWEKPGKNDPQQKFSYVQKFENGIGLLEQVLMLMILKMMLL